MQGIIGPWAANTGTIIMIIGSFAKSPKLINGILVFRKLSLINCRAVKLYHEFHFRYRDRFNRILITVMCTLLNGYKLNVGRNSFQFLLQALSQPHTLSQLISYFLSPRTSLNYRLIKNAASAFFIGVKSYFTIGWTESSVSLRFCIHENIQCLCE